ncbi:MAG: FtsX-like permease family protein, partial [Candidatus Hermodarchaeota archaeon]
KIGDHIYVKPIASEDSKRLIITGIINDLVESTLFISIDKAQEILNETDNINTIYFLSDEVKETAEEVLDLPQIEQVVKKKELEKDVDFVLELASTMFFIFGVIFFVFGLLLLFIIFKSIIDYRIEDYSNMKAIGLYNSEIRKTLLLEMGFYFIVALLLGLLFGFIIMAIIIDMYSSISPGLKFYLYPTSYLTYIMTFSIILFSSYVYNYSRIKKINVAEVMRQKI